MNIYIRKFLLFISYTAFVIIAPLVILYAIGYRPQVSSPIPRPVGVILADAAPKRATITVNGISHGTLPRSVSNIEPGIATVQVTKDGYTAWEKKLEVKPTQATDIRSIHLMPAIFERDMLAENISHVSQSPNNLFLAAVKNTNTLTVLDETGETLLPDIKLLGTPSAISWSPDSSHILVVLPKNTYEILHLQNTILEKVPSKQLAGLTNLSWNPSAVNTLYGIDKSHALISYTVSTAVKEVLIKNVNTFTIADRTLYYQTVENELHAKQLRSDNTRTVIPDTKKAMKKIAVSSNGVLALLFTDGELQIQKTNGDIISIAPQAESSSWSPDGQLLLVQTAPTELSLFNVENERLFAVPLGELHPITRLSQPIVHPQWFSDSLHIFYQSNNSIIFSEIDTRDHPIALPIDTTKNLAPVTFADKSTSIIYIQKNGTESRLIKTWLVTNNDR